MKNSARTGSGRASICGAFLALTSLCTPQAAAQPLPNYGLDWARVGEAGNRGTTELEAPALGGASIGAVEREFRISKTVLSVGQWLEFVEAYEPYYTGPRNASAFTGSNIGYSRTLNRYLFNPGSENFPANMSWRFAARYANWLHNDKASEQWAFENGAYDTSTFVSVPGTGIRGDQIEHNPDAKFWIPTLDEWTKAVYYDPNRYGAGEEGYWLHPDGTNVPLVPGLPGEPGAETSAGELRLPSEIDIGLYPNTPSLRGLLDASGGDWEWTETVSGPRSTSRYTPGTKTGQIDYFHWDRIDLFFTSNPTFAQAGLRLASDVPNPGTGVFLASGLILIFTRRKR